MSKYAFVPAEPGYFLVDIHEPTPGNYEVFKLPIVAWRVHEVGRRAEPVSLGVFDRPLTDRPFILAPPTAWCTLKALTPIRTSTASKTNASKSCTGTSR